MKQLSKADTCRVRLESGKIGDAVYLEKSELYRACHYVEHNGDCLMVRSKIEHDGHCRFVGPSCDLLPVGVSV